jgi:Stress responsive A/B Barrel Domain
MDNTTRRQFIGNTGKAAIAGTAIFAPSLNSTRPKMENVFIHHVFFWLNNPDSKTDRDKLVEGLNNLSKVKVIQQFHIGQPAETNRDVIERTYAVSWLLNFANAADQESYQTDPIHLKFVEDYKHLWKKVIVYDSVDLK